MDVFEKFTRKDKEAQLAENPEPKEIKGDTIKQILADTNKSELFGLYLQGEGDEARELAIKLKSGDATALGREELAALNEKRKGFLEILERSKNTTEILDSGTLREIIETSPELKDIAAFAGEDGMRKAIKDYLPRMAVMDRGRFELLSNRAVTVRGIRNDMTEKKKEISKLWKDYGITEDRYIEIIQTGDRDELKKLVKSQMGFFEKIFTRSKTINKEVDQLDQAGEIRQQLKDLDLELKNVGSVLQMALMDNEVLHEALVAETTKEGEAPKLETGMSFGEMKKMTDEDLKKAKESFYQELRDKNLDLDGIPDGRYQQEVDRFSQEYFSKAGKGKKGFWAAIWESLCAPKLAESLKRKK